MVARASDYLISRGYSVRFVPFHTVPPDDDRLEITRVLNLMKRGGAETLPRPASPEAALRLTAEAGLVVGLRLHSLILAGLSGTPVASVGYDLKIDGFMRLAGVSRYLCHAKDGLDALTARVGHLIDDHDEARRTLAENVEMMRRRISSESLKVARLLSGRRP
jgi:polysaccharide pyruvyl transferase WcaK-like protein